MPRRRLLAVAIAGALALPALVACRDLPSVAAYVGSAQLTNAQVQRMVDEFPADRRQTDTGGLRRGIVLFADQADLIQVGTRPGMKPERDVISQAELVHEPSDAMGFMGFVTPSIALIIELN